MVVDMPSEPVMHSVEIHKLKNHVAELESHLRYIKSHIPSLEIQLQKEKQDEKDFEQYSAERKALDAKYQNRFNGMS